MSRDYQFDRDAYNPYEQDYDSGYSSQNREYRDLYNPYKSNWERALKYKPQKQATSHKPNYRATEETNRFSGNKNIETNRGHKTWVDQKLNKTNSVNSYNNRITQDEGSASDSGYDVTRKNTYGYRTTGYGPRD